MLSIPTLILKRPDWDKFPGSDFTIAFDIIMPDKKTLQIGTIHHLSNNFSKTYDIRYEDINGEHKLINQSCYGISERCIASIIALHGDDYGLILPPDIAPIQIVIIPILFNEGNSKILNQCYEIEKELQKNNFRTIIDDSNQRPGVKYYKWELKGVCLRLEIGPREVINKTVIIVDRIERNKESINIEQISELIKLKLNKFNEKMYLKAKNFMKQHIFFYKTINEIKNKHEINVLKVPLCYSLKCGLELGNKLELSILGTDIIKKNDSNYECIICKTKTKNIVYLSKKY